MVFIYVRRLIMGVTYLQMPARAQETMRRTNMQANKHHARTHARAHTRTRAHTHARTHTHAQTYASRVRTTTYREAVTDKRHTHTHTHTWIQINVSFIIKAKIILYVR